MENVQRSVMLLKPDAHIMGHWDSGATLKLNATAGGLTLTLSIDRQIGEQAALVLFMRDGAAVPAGEITSDVLNVQLTGVRLADVSGAAVIAQDRFILKSAGPDWPAIIARYRFANKARQAAPGMTQPPDAAPTQEIEQRAASPLQSQPEDIEAQDFLPPQKTELPPQFNAPQPETTDYPIAEPETDTDDFPPQYAPGREPQDECPGGIRQDHIDPFPGVFPGSEWVKISYPGPAGWWHYIFGRVRISGTDADVIGVPGEYSMAPPVWLDGFSTWVRCASDDARGYWLMFQDAQTGRILDISRSPHGG